MTSPLDQVSCASLPVHALAVLAEVRCSPEVQVRFEGERVWVRWEPGNEQMLRRVLPVAGVELYHCRDGLWYRLGNHLPSFDLPLDEATQPLHRALTPAPFQAVAFQGTRLQPCKIRLVRDERPRSTTAVLCRLPDLRAWGDTATSAQLASLRAAHAGDQVLLLGTRLPALADSERFWGRRVLTPLGYRFEPALPESALLDALGVDGAEFVLLRMDGAEVLSERVFQPLARAGLRSATREAAEWTT
jgi:hypothetical protein